MTGRFLRLLWQAAPFSLFSGEALAWGLQTHLFFAQYVLVTLPFADPELRAAALRLPRMVLAGACLPDLAVIGRFFLGTPAFARAHRWSTLRRLIAAPQSDHDRALALGYATHLVSDVVAHHRFVPEHEARIGRGAMLAHLVSEWAMDSHLRSRVPAQPAEVLDEARPHAADFVARGMRCGEPLARRALDCLARSEHFLRRSPLPLLCRKALRLGQGARAARFEAYLGHTTAALRRLETALAGGYEDWCGSDPEGSGGDQAADGRSRQHVARVMQAEDHA